jgi:uncharacterized membrane-anchored protein
MKTTTTKNTSAKTAEMVKAIDKQLKAILEKDIRIIDNIHLKNAAFLQLIAA